MIRLDAVTLKQLRALAAVDRHGSMAAAGAALGLTPPAIHSQLKGLEQAFGLALLQRSSDSAGSVLTEEGRVLLEAHARMEAVLARAALEIRALSEGLAGRVTLGVVSTGKYFAPRLVKILATLTPNVEVVLRVGNRDQVIRDLETRSVDLAIMGRPPRQPLVEAAAIGPHPHGLIAPPDHPLAGRPALSASDLYDETMISREEGSGTRILMTRYLDRLGDGRPFRLVEMGSNETIKQSVMAGLGIAFLSLHTVTDELHQGRLVTLAAPGLPIQRHWFLVHPSDQALRPASRAVSDAVLALKGTFLPDVPQV
jgi:DNA-binding transcriptional LysR family regulator